MTLIGKEGVTQFDRLTKTKTVENILTATNVPSVNKYLAHLLSQFSKPTDDIVYVFLCKTISRRPKLDLSLSNGAPSERSWIMDQLAMIVRNGAIPKDDQSCKVVLEFFSCHGHFRVVKHTKKELEAAVCQALPPLFRFMPLTLLLRLFL